MLNNPDTSPSVVISIDFELRWGVHDKVGFNLDSYRKQLEGAKEAVPSLLEKFETSNIKATWATVGALACQNWDEYEKRAPKAPSYWDKGLKINPRYKELDPSGDLHFAPDLVEAIVNTPHQELASHTFSHLFFAEPGVMSHDAIADTQATRQVFEDKYNITPRTIVFPRNQVAFVPFLAEQGLRCFRGRESPWYCQLSGKADSHPLPRWCRLVDSFLPVNRGEMMQKTSMLNIPASVFLRLYLPPSLFKLHMARIKNELSLAKHKGLVHLWFHPHNLGQNIQSSLKNLEQVLDYIAELKDKNQLASRTMTELWN